MKTGAPQQRASWRLPPTVLFSIAVIYEFDYTDQNMYAIFPCSLYQSFTSCRDAFFRPCHRVRYPPAVMDSNSILDCHSCEEVWDEEVFIVEMFRLRQ